MSFEIWMARLGSAFSLADASNREAADRASSALERVSAVLLIEIARSDHEVDDAERATIQAALAASSSLPGDELDAIIDSAIGDSEANVTLHGHIRQINDSLDKPGKIALVEQMWRVALADGDLDGYEEYTIRKLADLLYLKHRDFMQAKLRVVDETDPST